jgi:hypothetical protein
MLIADQHYTELDGRLIAEDELEGILKEAVVA